MSIKKILQNCTKLNNWYINQKWKERKLSLGKENSDKVFYVIRRATGKVGLFSYVSTNLGHIKYALDQGYIPIVDMQNNPNTYLEEEQVGKKNAWEFYFKQPCGYSLNDIKKSKNIILSSGLINCGVAYPDAQIANDDEKLKMWKAVADKYLKVNEDVEKEAEKKCHEIFENARVLGVLARGTDYVQTRPRKHPVQPEVEQLIEKCREIMEKCRCEKLYLTTEDEKIYSEFENVFGDRLISMNVKRYQTRDKENINDVINKGMSKYVSGKEYLISILLLAKCHCLVAGNAGGTQGALLFNEGYEYKCVFDLGVY